MDNGGSFRPIPSLLISLAAVEWRNLTFLRYVDVRSTLSQLLSHIRNVFHRLLNCLCPVNYDIERELCTKITSASLSLGLGLSSPLWLEWCYAEWAYNLS